jgi:hypothetical protein
MEVRRIHHWHVQLLWWGIPKPVKLGSIVESSCTAILFSILIFIRQAGRYMSSLAIKLHGSLPLDLLRSFSIFNHLSSLEKHSDTQSILGEWIFVFGGFAFFRNELKFSLAYHSSSLLLRFVVWFWLLGSQRLWAWDADLAFMSWIEKLVGIVDGTGGRLAWRVFALGIFGAL